MILIILALIIGIVYYYFNLIGIYTIAKRRGIENSWIAFIPIINLVVYGDILDNINAYENRKTHYKFVMITLLFLTTATTLYTMASVAYYGSYSHNLWNFIFIIITFICFNILILIVKYYIYKDYAPKLAVLLLIFTIFFKIDYAILFVIRKKVPVSMCFSINERWLFELNQLRLQSLWEEYHFTKPQNMTFGEFLLLNFIPVTIL